MAKTSNLNIRMDANVKAEAEALFGSYGLSLTDAVNVFFHQSLKVGGLPFDLRPQRPNAETIAAIMEAERLSRDPNAKTFTNLDELWKDLGSDDV